MNPIQKIAKNTTSLVVMQLVTMGLGLIFTSIIARFLGVADFGKYNFALAFTSLYAIITDLGFNQLLIREISRDHVVASKYIGNIVPLKLLLSIIFFIIIFISINLMNYPYDTKMVVYIFAVYTILTSFGGLIKALFNAFEIMEYTSFFTIIEKIVIVSIGSILLYLDYSLIIVVLAYIIAGITSIVLCMTMLNKKILCFKVDFDFAFWKYLITSAIPFGIFVMFMTINYTIDTVMLSFLKGDLETGWYNAAYNLVNALGFIPSAIVMALFPLLSKLSTRSRDSLKFACEKCLKYLLILAIPITIGTILLANKIIMLIYGEQFVNSVVALQILSISIIPVFYHNGLGSIILVLNKEKNAIYMWTLCAILNVTLNYTLIPIYGIIGACITTLISELFICIQFNYFLSRHLYRISIANMIYKPLIGSLLMGIFIFYFKNLNIFFLIFVASIFYFTLLYLIRTFDGEDIKLFRQLTR